MAADIAIAHHHERDELLLSCNSLRIHTRKRSAARSALLCPISQNPIDSEDDDSSNEDDNWYGSAHGTVHPEQPPEHSDGYEGKGLEPGLLEVMNLEIAHCLGVLLVDDHTHFISLIASPPGASVRRSDLLPLQILSLPMKSATSRARPRLGLTAIGQQHTGRHLTVLCLITDSGNSCSGCGR